MTVEAPSIRGYHTEQGIVLGTYINPLSQSISVEKPEIKLIVGKGVVGDNHYGERLSDTREDVLKAIGVGKEVPMANVRQLSIVSKESLQEAAKVMGHPIGIRPVLNPALLGANLCIDEMIVDSLPAGTLLCFASIKNELLTWHKAVIYVAATNDPCKIPHENIIADVRRTLVLRDWVPDKPFAQAAKGLRGVVGFVYTSGKIKRGDICVAYTPE